MRDLQEKVHKLVLNAHGRGYTKGYRAAQRGLPSPKERMDEEQTEHEITHLLESHTTQQIESFAERAGKHYETIKFPNPKSDTERGVNAGIALAQLHIDEILAKRNQK